MKQVETHESTWAAFYIDLTLAFGIGLLVGLLRQFSGSSLVLVSLVLSQIYLLAVSTYNDLDVILMEVALRITPLWL